MQVEQISIFIENTFGRLADVTRILGDAGVNIRTLSLADTSDFGIVRLLVDDTERANSALKESGFTVSKTEVVAVEIPDVPGGLAEILQALGEEGINVEYMYAFVERRSEHAIMIFRFDETEKAIAALSAKNFTVLPGERLAGM